LSSWNLRDQNWIFKKIKGLKSNNLNLEAETTFKLFINEERKYTYYYRLIVTTQVNKFIYIFSGHFEQFKMQHNDLISKIIFDLFILWTENTNIFDIFIWYKYRMYNSAWTNL
jgi:hypothetical protein